MAHSEERKKAVVETLYTEAGGNASKCARLTGVDRKTILKWKEEHEACKKEEHPDSTELPGPTEIKERIIRRVYEIIETCADPKKLMDTYDAISKFEKEAGKNKKSFFELLEQKVNKK